MKYLKQISIIAACCIGLAACGEPSEEEIAKVARKLPMGCTVEDLGSYGAIEHLVVVDCVGRRVQTTNWQRPAGKTSTPQTAIFVE